VNLLHNDASSEEATPPPPPSHQSASEESEPSLHLIGITRFSDRNNSSNEMRYTSKDAVGVDPKECSAMLSPKATKTSSTQKKHRGLEDS
jgi:hypothetical protein